MIELILTIIATILDDCEDELDHPDDDDGLLERDSEHRGEAGPAPAHAGQVSGSVILCYHKSDDIRTCIT